MYDRILVATDGGPLSKKAVKHAIDLAKLSAAELLAVKVTPRYPQTYLEGGYALPASEIAQIEKQWAAQAQAVVDAAVKAAKTKGVKAKGLPIRGEMISDTIIATAKKHKADLIVMASHGRKGIKRLLLGSETQQVLTHSKIPVLVLR